MSISKDLKELVETTVQAAVEGAVESLLPGKKQPSKEVLKIAVTEQRRFHDELTSAARAVKSRIIYFIAAIFTLLTFLYAGAATRQTSTGQSVSIRERLFIPETLYGIVFYAIGVCCILYALGKLIYAIKPGDKWSVPFSSDDYLNLTETDDRAYLMLLKNEYVKTTNTNLRRHEIKNRAIWDSYFPLIIGAIILVVLRYFQ